MERYEEPTDDVMAWFSAHGVALDQEQRYQVAKLEVIEGSDGLLQLWAALSGGVEERIQAVNAIQEQRRKEGWRLETDYQADKEALLRAAAADRRQRQERTAAAKEEQRSGEKAAKAAREKRWAAFEQAKGRLVKEWGKGAWSTLEADLRGVEWGEWRLRVTVRQTSVGATRKAAYLSTAMSEILGGEFTVEIVPAGAA